jgi:hypothetical protein
VRAAQRHLPQEEALAYFREMMQDDEYALLFSTIVQDGVLRYPAPVAAEALAPMWEEAPSALKRVIASTLYASDDLVGTHYLREELRNGSAQHKLDVLNALYGGDLEYLLDDVLMLSVDPDPAVRAAVVRVIALEPGENIDNVLTSLAVDPEPAVRQPALATLLVRGHREQLDRLIERVRTASGSKLVQALGDLAAARDGEAVAVMLERLKSSPPNERRKYMQAIGRSGTRAAFEAMVEIFLAPEEPIDPAGEQTNVTYAAVMFPNLIEAHEDILRLFGRLDRGDYRRRAAVMFALGNVASLARDESFRDRTYDLFRAVVRDRTEIPQMRLLALEYVRRDLVASEDLEQLESLLPDEESAMQRALVAFLHEFF